jgi:glycosyltransferase involved in cell wall biosynthesis
MKIASITSGAAGMYCGSCMRDNTLAAALIAQGHDCVLVPTYTPIRTDEKDVSLPRVFFGGISIYLEQKTALFRHMPGFLDRMLSLPRLLNWVSNFAIKTRPEDLGDLTISMLQGTAGHQRREVLQLARWLTDEFRPEVICLSNALISGIVPELKRHLGVPILCTLQGDDIYLEWLPEAYKRRALELVRQNCQQIDGYLTTSRYYADFMAGYLGLPRDQIHVVYPGINLKGYDAADAKAPTSSSLPPTPYPLPPAPLTVGYLARICPEKGLHVLVEAFEKLCRTPGVPPCRLRAAGYLGERDRPYLDDLRKRIEQGGWADRFEYVGAPDHAGKVAFLQSLDVFSVPTTYREPKGLYLLEAWACGVPVVQPRHGSFPELIEATGGGLLVNPEDSTDLANSLRRLLSDHERRRELGRQGREAVWQRFHAGRMAEDTLQIFARYSSAPRSPARA